jgi:5-hydroxyisourate hydrolase-like protein (transthyretin family)
MWRAARVSSIGLALALVVLTCATAEAARRGRVSGVVLDQAGVPVAGASVAVFVADAEADTPVRNAVTNGEGRFTVSVAPGSYLLRAAATGFTAFEARALVASHRETVLDTIALQRQGTLAERRRTQGNAYRRVVRSSRGHVFNIDEEPEAVRELDDAALLAEGESHNSTHGALQFVGAAGDRAYSSTNFALTRRALGSDVTVTAQLGSGEGAPRRFEALARKDAGENHEFAVTFGYGSVDAFRDGERVPLGQYAVQVTDRWRVAGPLVLL